MDNSTTGQAQDGGDIGDAEPELFAPGAKEPQVAAVCAALLIPMCVAWAVYCYVRAHRPGYRASRVMLVLSACWVVYAVDSLANTAFAALYLRCRTPYVYLRPPIFDQETRRVCLAMAFYVVGDFTTPVGVVVFISASITRFLLTVKAVAENTAYRFIRAATVIMALALAVKLAALVLVEKYAATHTIDPASDPATEPSFAVWFHVVTDTGMYSLGALLDVLSVVLGISFIYRAFSSSAAAQRARQREVAGSGVLDAEWPVKGVCAEVRRLKVLERRHLLFAALMLVCNVALVLLFCVINMTSALAGMSFVVRNLIYSTQIKAYSCFEMCAINALSQAVVYNRKAVREWAIRLNDTTLIGNLPYRPSSTASINLGGHPPPLPAIMCVAPAVVVGVGANDPKAATTTS